MQNCGSSFVNSCVKMPIDPYSRQPTPSYERPTTALNSSSPDKSDKCSKTEDNTTPSELMAEACSPANVQDFLDFLNSIPDYGEIHHLSNEQFSQQLEYLKRKRTILLTNLQSDESKKSGKDPKKVLGGKKGAKKKRKSRNKEKQKYGDDYKLNLKGKKCRLEEGLQSPLMFERRNFKDLTRDQDLLNYRLSNKDEKSLRNKEILFSARSWSDRSDELKRNCIESDAEFCNENKTLTSTTPQKWHPTLPKPFTFTIREDVEKHMSNIECQSNKTSPSLKKRSRSRKRRPRKIPKTSRIPLYDKLMAEKEERSRIIREESAINLLSQIQPFKLECEQRAWKCISRSSPDLTSRKSNSSLQFKAKPVPKNLFNTDIYDKMLEDEYFRHLQKKIRAMDLLKSSSLPPSMARRQKVESSSLNSNNVHSKNSTCGKSSKASGFYTSSSSSDRPKSSIMTKRNDGTNLAAILRCQASRQKLEQEIQARLAERERIENEKFRQALLAKKPAWKALRIAARYDHERDLNYRTKLRRNEAREQAEHYRLQMELMLDRVTRIPTLFERYSQNFNLYAQSLRDLQQNNKSKVSKLGRSSTESYASFGSSSTSSLRFNTGSSMSSSETIVSLSNNSSNSSKSSKSRKPAPSLNTRKKNDRGALKVSINENAELIEDKLELETNDQLEIEDKVQEKDDEHSQT